MDRMKSLREKMGYTQQAVADMINISRLSYVRYESGERTPNADVILALADLYGVSTDYLLGRTDTPYVYGMDLGDGAAAEIRTTRKPSPVEQERLEKMAIDMKATGAGTPVPPGADLEDMVRRLVDQILSERVQDPSGRS